MKTTLLFSAVSLVAVSLLAADSADEVKAAAKKLGAQDNYSWTTTIKMSEGTGGNFRPGPAEGKTEKDGLTWLSMTAGDNTTVAVLKGAREQLNGKGNGSRWMNWRRVRVRRGSWHSGLRI
jgi:hypothetical protein